MTAGTAGIGIIVPTRNGGAVWGETPRAILARTFDFAVSPAGLPGSLGLRSYLGYLRRELAFVLREGGPAALPWALALEAARCAGYLLGDHHRRLPAGLCRRISGYPHWFDSTLR
jgi:hypothetical protein